jgi:hypothetical protein
MNEARSIVAQLLAVRPDLTIADLMAQGRRMERPGDSYFVKGMRLAGLPEGNLAA